MAAEKLTKARLAQILFMMVVLVIAFTWRSVTHSNKEVLCDAEQNCTVQIDQLKIELEWQGTSKTYRLPLLKSNQDLTFKSVGSNAEISITKEYVEVTIKQYPAKLSIKNVDQSVKNEVNVYFR